MGKAWERGKLNWPKGKEGEFSLEKVDGAVKAVEAIVLQPGEISGVAPFKGNSRRINVFTEPLTKMALEGDATLITIPSYSECKNGSSRVDVAVRNISRKVVVIAKGQQIAEVTAANQVPNMLAPNYVNPTPKDTKIMVTNQPQGRSE